MWNISEITQNSYLKSLAVGLPDLVLKALAPITQSSNTRAIGLDGKRGNFSILGATYFPLCRLGWLYTWSNCATTLIPYSAS